MNYSVKYLKFSFVLTVFCACIVSSNGQNVILEKENIKWEGIKRQKITDNYWEEFLYFKEAIYRSDNGFLPFYSKNIELKSAIDIFSVELVDPVYSPLTSEENNLIKRKDSVFSSINIKYTVRQSRNKYYLEVNFLPIRNNNGSYEKLVSWQLKINYNKDPNLFKKQLPLTQASSNSVLSSGNWYKIGITKTGIYKMDHNFLKSIGIEPSEINPKNIRIYGNGGGMLPLSNSTARYDDLQENAIKVVGENDGVFDTDDYVLFYGKGQHTWSYNSSDQRFHHRTNYMSDTAYYFITTDLGTGKRIFTQSSSTLPLTHSINSFDDYDYRENDAENFIKSGREWYGDKMDILASLDYSFANFPNLIMGAPAYVRTDIAARYDQPYQSNTFKVQVGNASANLSPGPCDFSCYFCDYATTAAVSFTCTATSTPFTVKVTKNLSSAVGWVNYVEVNVRRHLAMQGGQMQFRDIQSFGIGNVGEFSVSNNNSQLEIWDVTDPVNVLNQQGILSGTDLVFRVNTDILREFIAFNSSSFYTPTFKGVVVNQDLHALKQQDLVIVSHPLFINDAERLANLHRTKDNLKTVVITPQQIYNEFSSGSQDIAAIRDFVKMLYDRAAGNPDSLPKYLLLFGDASYDMKNRFSSNTNFIPSFESANSVSLTNSYVSDDFFGLMNSSEGDLDAGGLIDIGIGRFPVKTQVEAKTIVDKIERYMSTGYTQQQEQTVCTSGNNSPFGDWRNVYCFIGDDEDGALHVSQANQLADSLYRMDKSYNLDKIFLDAYVQESTPGGDRYPDVVDAINRRVNKGALLIGYSGHGGEVGLAHERIIELNQINSWNNAYQLPLFVTATCEFSRFDDPARTSAGEQVFLNPDGGGIGLLTTVRLVYAGPNFVLCQNFYSHLYDTLNNGEIVRIGDVLRMTKVQSGSSVNNKVFTLLCDPALRLAFPKHKVSTTVLSEDTLKALSPITITGYVKDNYGNKLSTYNGVMYPTVFDKMKVRTTLSNDGPSASPAYSFTDQKNIIYKGKVSVINGDFSFSFVVPKDVASEGYGKGKISYYFENGNEDGNGYYDSLTIGGVSSNAPSDITGPDVKLFLNDNKFVYGGTTNENPYLYAEIKDENGVNTSGIGIGHDITAVLDGNTGKSIQLNDYYEADMNSYKTGRIKYQLNNLSEGTHTLKLKVWDVYNNSSDAYLEFVVAPKAQLALKHVLNYPNPFTTRTAFYFEHNQGCEQMNVQVQVFTVSGKLVKTISENIECIGYRNNPLYWDGRDDYGDKLGRGVYVYRVKVKTADNQVAEQFEKLVILN